MVEHPDRIPPADLALQSEVWDIVGELTKPLYGHQVIPVLMALRIVVSHYLEIMKDPQDTLQRLVWELNAALEAALELKRRLH
jgi:hypothetical protein